VKGRARSRPSSQIPRERLSTCSCSSRVPLSFSKGQYCRPSLEQLPLAASPDRSTSFPALEISTMASRSTSIATLDPLSPELPAASTGSSTVGKELLAGTVAGWAQVMVGQPCKFPFPLATTPLPAFARLTTPLYALYTVDIVKVRLQAGNVQYAGALDCARQLVQTEGAKSFYKGESLCLPIRGPSFLSRGR